MAHGHKLSVKPLLLIIEDDPAQIYLRKKVLEQAGYNVVCATSTEEGIEILKETPVCCVIADHMLKGESGADAAERMKLAKPDVPIVLFSGSLPNHMRGVDVFINKGQPTAQFISIVGDVVRRYCE